MTLEPESSEDIQQLFIRLRTEGIDTSELIDWRSKSLGAILLATESGAYYVIEPVQEQPSLITRFSEATPFHGEYRLPGSETMIRKPGNPSKALAVGKPVDIYGLPRRGTEFDPDSSYQTLPLVGIKYLDTQL